MRGGCLVLLMNNFALIPTGSIQGLSVTLQETWPLINATVLWVNSGYYGWSHGKWFVLLVMQTNFPAVCLTSDLSAGMAVDPRWLSPDSLWSVFITWDVTSPLTPRTSTWFRPQHYISERYSSNFLVRVGKCHLQASNVLIAPTLFFDDGWQGC